MGRSARGPYIANAAHATKLWQAQATTNHDFVAKRARLPSGEWPVQTIMRLPFSCGQQNDSVSAQPDAGVLVPGAAPADAGAPDTPGRRLDLILQIIDVVRDLTV